MPKLTDYIGSLVSSITNARVMSDIQTVKVAEEYAKHDLLRHFSIPRMRIDDIEMTIPIALDELDEKIVTEYEPLDQERINTLVYKELVSNIGLVKLPVKIAKHLSTEIAQQTQILEQNIRTAKDLNALADYIEALMLLSSGVEKELDKTKINQKRDIETFPKRIEKMLTEEIKIRSQKKVLEDLNVIIEAHKLREQKPENIIYIKLKISEDGMEWNRAENSKGVVEEKLLPE